MTLNRTITTSIPKENDSNYLSSSVYSCCVNKTTHFHLTISLLNLLYSHTYFLRNAVTRIVLYINCSTNTQKSTNWQAKYYIHNTSLTYYQRRLMGPFYVWVTAKSHHKIWTKFRFAEVLQTVQIKYTMKA